MPCQLMSIWLPLQLNMDALKLGVVEGSIVTELKLPEGEVSVMIGPFQSVGAR